MKIQSLHRAFLWTVFFAAVAAASSAQTDIALSLYGTFSNTAAGIPVSQTPSSQAGGMVELRHIVNPLIGFEGTYSFNRANQKYSPGVVCFLLPSIPGGCEYPPISANAHEITADWIPSMKLANLRVFGVLGAGVLATVPEGTSPFTQLPGQPSTSTRAVYVYGVGVDWPLLPRFGLHAQYRGNFYKAPSLLSYYGTSDSFLHTAEPMIGAYFRF